jgi:hypothetical protein
MTREHKVITIGPCPVYIAFDLDLQLQVEFTNSTSHCQGHNNRQVARHHRHHRHHIDTTSTPSTPSTVEPNIKIDSDSTKYRHLIDLFSPPYNRSRIDISHSTCRSPYKLMTCPIVIRTVINSTLDCRLITNGDTRIGAAHPRPPQIVKGRPVL